MQLSIDLLRTFVAVVDTMSFTRAGLAVHRTQSAVSMQMRRLEEEIGRSLFEKNGKTFKLTLMGETLIDHARRVLKVHDDALAVITKPDLTGRIRFGSCEDYASLFLPEVLSRFSLSYPNIRVDLYGDPSLKLRRAIEMGELDLALFTDMEVGEIVRREPLVWLTSSNFLAHEEDPVPLAVYHDGCIFRKWAIRSLTETGRNYRIAYVSHSMSGILAAVKAGLAVAPVGIFHYRPGFRILSVKDGFPALPEVTITLLTAQSPPSDTVECFARYVMDSFMEMGKKNPRTEGFPVAGV